MLQTLTKIKISDNSGVKNGQCIKVLQKKKNAKIGDFILISVKKLKKYSNLKIKKKDIIKAIVINTKKENKYLNFCTYKFDENKIVLLNKKNNLIGTRIFGIISKSLRKKKLIKFLTQSTYII